MQNAPTFIFFFFNDTATTEIYTLSLHDALPISATASRSSSSCAISSSRRPSPSWRCSSKRSAARTSRRSWRRWRSEEHTSELQSLTNLVCRLLLEKKKHQRQLLYHTSHERCCTT